MNARRSGRVPADDKSALPSMRGLPGWAAVVLAVAASVTGIAVDAITPESGLGAGFTVAYVLGCVAAVLLVARRSVFVAGVQPPLIMVTLVPLAYLVAAADGLTGGFSQTTLIAMVLPVLTRFPLMLTATLVVVALALIRAYVLEPDTSRRGARRRRGAHARR